MVTTKVHKKEKGMRKEEREETNGKVSSSRGGNLTCVAHGRNKGRKAEKGKTSMRREKMYKE